MALFVTFFLSLVCFVIVIEVFLFFTVGKAKTHVISNCRNAIKTNDVDALLKIIKHGTLAVG